MTDRRIVGADARGNLRKACRFVRLLSMLLVSVIGLGVAQVSGDAAMDDDADGDERVIFRHFV